MCTQRSEYKYCIIPPLQNLAQWHFGMKVIVADATERHVYTLTLAFPLNAS